MIPGRTEAAVYAISCISALASLTDVIWGRIYNALTLPAALLGVFYGAMVGGGGGIADSLAGMFAGFGFYGWMFWFGAMGAGDVKLLMALGAWGGFRFSAEVALVGVVFGGFMAFGILVFQGKIGGFFRRINIFIINLLNKDTRSALSSFDGESKMPYGVPIAAAALWIAWGNPLEGWGIGLWR